MMTMIMIKMMLMMIFMIMIMLMMMITIVMTTKTMMTLTMTTTKMMMMMMMMMMMVIMMMMMMVIMTMLELTLSRHILDQVIKSPDCFSLLQLLEERQTQRRLARLSPSQPPVYPEISHQLQPVFRRLSEAGMLPAVEDKILALREGLKNISSVT